MIAMDSINNSFETTSEDSDGIIAETDRLVIRELTLDDTKDYRNLADICEGGIDPSLKGLSKEEFTSRHKAYIKYQYGFYGYGNWGMFLKDGTFIGIIGIHNADESEVGEIGYAVLPQYRGLGYASEAVAAILPYAYEDIGFLSIVARIAPDNLPSLAIAGRFGIKVVTETGDMS